jgi:PAS domain S-box-containing protein
MFEEAAASIKSPSPARQKVLLWIAFLVIIAVSGLAFVSIQQLIKATDRVERSQLLLIEINHFLSDLKDVETGGRGYALSGGDERHLERQEQGVAATRTTVGRLRELIDEPELRHSLEALFQLAELRIASSRKLVAERSDPAKTRRNLLEGLLLMDRIRQQESIIFSVQQRQYQTEREQLKQEARETSLALAGGVALCLALIAWLFALRGREVDRRRQLEEELRALNLDLEARVNERTSQVKRASDLLDAVVENLPDMILLKEPENDGFRYLLVNAAGEKLLGRDRRQIIGKTERDLFPPDEAAIVVQTNRDVAETGQARTFTDRKLTTRNGVRTVETRVVPIFNSAGTLALILAIVRDVTDAKAREDQIRQLQRMDAIGRLTGGIAHDFNNLLAIIHGNSELLRNRLADNSDEAEMTDDVIDASARGAELVRRLLAFARMQHLEAEAVDLNARLQSIEGLLRRSLGEDFVVRIKAAEGLWPAVVDPTQVDDAVVNLAINARDAMRGGGTLTIETENVMLDEDYAAHHAEVVPGPYVMLAISDTGTGMPPEVAARAFEPFFTTKEEGQGTGLGLSQVFGWVKQSGGHIKIYSEVGHGTTIKLYLPRAEKPSPGKAAEAEVSTPNGSETILVVEDNANVRKTVIRQLHDLGYHTVEAASGGEALELVKDGLSFDLLLSDVIMPGGMTGYQLADQMRVSRPDVKVLFTSGYTELAANGGGPRREDPLLSKPYRKQDLGRAVRAALDQARSETRAAAPD